MASATVPQNNQECSEMAKHPFGNAVGSLLFLAMTTQPDIAFFVSVLCCFILNPGQPHWHAVQHLFHYLQGTKDICLTDRGDKYDPEHVFIAFTDSDHAGNADNS